MARKIGIRREDKNIWERRVPLIPDQVRELVKDGLEVAIQPSPIRAFAEDAYRKAGASIQEDLSDCPFTLAVKEIPIPLYAPKHAYMFFAHVIKGQPYNMPMLRKILDLGCTLIDYEKVTDDQGRRLIFFGRHAGLAGMLDSLWALGKRLQVEGIKSPFAALQPTHKYESLARIREAVTAVGKEIADKGLPPEISPLTIGFTGYGNVSRGAQEIFDILPHEEVQPEHLAQAARGGQNRKLIKVVFREEHMVRPIDPTRPFDLQEYYKHPERYQRAFDRYAPLLSVMVNCIYWAPQYPRLVTREDLRQLYAHKDKSGKVPLRVIGDISCDVNGAVECTLECTEPGDPVFVYLVKEDRIARGVEGDGPVVLAVDNLPCEIPTEASRDFGNALMPFVPAMARCDFDRPFANLDLPAPIRRAVIAHQGLLTPDFAYLREKLNSGGEP